MINAVFFKDKSGYYGFDVSGHAGYAEYGEDIICAGVSSALMLTANTITDFFGLKAQITQQKNNIVLKVLNLDDADNADKLIGSFKTHLDLVEEEYHGTIEVLVKETNRG